MSSQFERMFEARAVPSIDREHCEDVTHLRRGNPADSETIPAIAVEEPPLRDTAAGAENVRTMRIKVAASASVSKDSTWVIRGDEWTTIKIGTPFAGRRMVWVKTRDAGVRTAKGRLQV